MLVLALDTSTPTIGVAVSQYDSTLAFLSYSRSRSDSGHLLSAVDSVLSQSGLKLEDLDAIACAIGPGSFTGLRVGIATAQGLAEGCGLKIVGVPTLEAYAYAMVGVEGLLCPMIDARKKEVYVAGYRWDGDKLTEAWPAMACSPEKLAFRVDRGDAILFGEGVKTYRSQLVASLSTRVRFGPTDIALSNAFRVARLGVERLTQKGGVEPAALRPIYGRPSEAELTTNKYSSEGKQL